MVGIVTACGTVLAVNHERNFLDLSLTARGEVTSLPHGGHHPEITFVTNAGEPVSARPGSVTALVIGDRVDIRYDPAMPRASAQIDTFLDRWMVSLLLGAFSTLCIVGGLKRNSVDHS
ncbi:DUF3592 domain-containing protein [Paraburkholderia sp. J7]|uniref:DUF3592 domain-containing protein n=1 Tax=Paraburkholderia sp. J7 TaxID=2805438 RepID=UPI0039EE9A2B